MPKRPLSEYRVVLQQRLLAFVAGALITSVVVGIFVWFGEPDKSPVVQEDSKVSVPVLVPPEQIFYEKFAQKTQELQEAIQAKEEEIQQRLNAQEERFLKETQALEDSLLSMHNKQNADLPPPPAKRTHISSYKQSLKSEDLGRVVAGSFAHGVLLSGMDARVGVGASVDPQPVVMLMTSDLIMPGDQPLSCVKACHVVGSGYGDMSSERVYIRLEKMSCQMDDGRLVETTVAGFVVGSDGRVGVRGRMVMRDGTLLLRGFWGGVLSGIADILRKPSPVLFSSVGQPTDQGVHYGNVFQQGLHKGGTSAIDRLSNYYIERAEQMQPVVQVSSGQQVSFVFHKEVRLGEHKVRQDIEYERHEKEKMHIEQYKHDLKQFQ